jgi:DNA-binding NarL/FixJ family response regulator
MTIRIVLIDDHAMLRDALRVMLAKEADIEIVGEAGDGQDALDLVAHTTPDVVVMDIAMPSMSGIEATRRLIQQHPGLKILALTTYTDKRFINEMLSVGAVGYIAKSAAGDQLVKAIRTVAQGQSYFCPEAANALLDSVRRAPPLGNSSRRAKEVLGRREQEVLALLAEGYSSTQIAQQLHIAASTVDVHRRNIMRKLNLHSVAELTKFAIREGLTAA